MSTDPLTREPVAEVPLSAAQIEAFHRDGFTIVRDVLDPDEVSRFRAYLVDLFEHPAVHRGDLKLPPKAGMRGGGVRIECLARYPETREFFAKPKLLGALRSLLGEEFLLFPEDNVQDSRYGGWHKDTTPMERAGETFQWDPGFRLVQCAVYLQDSSEYGGGLDVVPGSHHEPDTTPPAPKVTLLDRVLWKLGRPRLKANDNYDRKDAISVPNRAGDLVMFDFHLDHRASQPKRGAVADIPDDQRKLTLFFSVGANNELSRRYRQYLDTVYEHLKDGHSYPADFLEFAESHRINLA